jgi:hypothetical protein
MIKILSNEAALNLIKTTLTTGGGGDDEVEYGESLPPKITFRLGARVTRVVESYDLDLSTIKIIAAYNTEDLPEYDYGDGTESTGVVFEMPEGHFGFACHDRWWDSTFGGDVYLLDVSESNDWDLFYNFSLTDSSREIINAFINPSLGLTSSNPKVRTLAEEIHSSGLTQNSK